MFVRTYTCLLSARTQAPVSSFLRMYVQLPLVLLVRMFARAFTLLFDFWCLALTTPLSTQTLFA